MSYDGRVYTVQVGNVVRDLPIFQVAPGVKIAIFNMLGDTEVVEEAARLLARRLPADAQVLVVPEVKAVPLGHALSVATGKPCVVVAQDPQALHGRHPGSRSRHHHHRRAADPLSTARTCA